MRRILLNLVITLSIASPLLAASPKIDTSTPKGTVKATFDLSAAGDFEAMMKLFVTPANDKEKELLADGFSDDMYQLALSTAVMEKFPDARVPNPGPMIERAKGEIDKMVEKIEGDTASLSPPDQPAGAHQGNSPFQQPIHFKKEGGAWKIAITENRFLSIPPAQFKESRKARCEALQVLIREVKAGKYASFEEFDKAMKTKWAEIQKLNQPAQPHPSGPSGGTIGGNPLDDPNLSGDDKKAAVILKEVHELLAQKKAAEAEAKLLEVFPLKRTLSPIIRQQVGGVIVGLGALDPTRATKLGPQWDKL